MLQNSQTGIISQPRPLHAPEPPHPLVTENWGKYRNMNVGQKRWVSSPEMPRDRSSMPNVSIPDRYYVKSRYDLINARFDNNNHSSQNGNYDVHNFNSFSSFSSNNDAEVATIDSVSAREIQSLSVGNGTDTSISDLELRCNSGYDDMEKYEEDLELVESLYQQIGYFPSSYYANCGDNENNPGGTEGNNDQQGPASAQHHSFRRKRPVSVFLEVNAVPKQQEEDASTVSDLNHVNAQQELRSYLSKIYSEPLLHDRYRDSFETENSRSNKNNNDYVDDETAHYDQYHQDQNQQQEREPADKHYEELQHHEDDIALTLNTATLSTVEPLTDCDGDCGYSRAMMHHHSAEKEVNATDSTSSVTLHDGNNNINTRANAKTDEKGNYKRESWIKQFFQSSDLEDCVDEHRVSAPATFAKDKKADGFHRKDRPKNITWKDTHSALDADENGTKRRHGHLARLRNRYLRLKDKVLRPRLFMKTKVKVSNE